MDELIWCKIVNALINNPIEIHTVPSNNKKPLWLEVYQDKGNIYAKNATIHISSC